MLGFETLGAGGLPVVVLNDWRCDTSTWDHARAYLDTDRFTWAFVDLRGYGRSKGQAGTFTLEEAAADVLALADARRWGTFAVVGHSMSTLIALHLAQQAPDRIERAVVLTPPPPTSFGVDDARLESIRAIARGDDSARLQYLRATSGGAWSEGWIRFRAERWRTSADPEAVAGYAAMFGQRGLPNPTGRIRRPVLAVTGELDMELMRRDAVTRFLDPLCESLVVQSIADSGHYPMQEAPPRLVAIVEHFLDGNA